MLIERINELKVPLLMLWILIVGPFLDIFIALKGKDLVCGFVKEGKALHLH